MSFGQGILNLESGIHNIDSRIQVCLGVTRATCLFAARRSPLAARRTGRFYARALDLLSQMQKRKETAPGVIKI